MDTDAEIDRLFALPAEEFTAARNALVKRLRAARQRADAERVAGLRRPTLPAWAVNQLARRHAGGVDELVAAGRELAQAQRRLLSGVRDAGLREATDRRRAAVADLTARAAGILEESGASPGAHRTAIARTLEAASVDPGAADQVRAGRLSAELTAPSGFAAVEGLALVDSPTAGDASAEPAGGDGDDAAGDAQA